MIPLERASQEEQNDAIFRFIAPSSEELWVRKQVGLIILYGFGRKGWTIVHGVCKNVK